MHVFQALLRFHSPSFLFNHMETQRKPHSQFTSALGSHPYIIVLLLSLTQKYSHTSATKCIIASAYGMHRSPSPPLPPLLTASVVILHPAKCDIVVDVQLVLITGRPKAMQPLQLLDWLEMANQGYETSTVCGLHEAVFWMSADRRGVACR
jgi:hypothetical protein